jgi:hypothetical protein
MVFWILYLGLSIDPLRTIFHTNKIWLILLKILIKKKSSTILTLTRLMLKNLLIHECQSFHVFSSSLDCCFSMEEFFMVLNVRQLIQILEFETCYQH